MNTRDALVSHLIEREFVRDGAVWEDCYAKFWIALPIWGWNLLFFPTWGRWGAGPLHDVNHMLSGCDTSWRGELEIAAWELGSGGCGWHLLYWLDRLVFVVFGCVAAPRAVLRGFQQGRQRRNVYLLPRHRVLEMDFENLRRYSRI